METQNDQEIYAQASSLPYPLLPTLSSNSPTKNRITKPTTLLPTAFVTTMPSPKVPIRLEPHEPLLDNLEADFRANGPHPMLGDISHNRKVHENAFAVLEKHVRDRMPFILAASRRLQAIVGIRNDLPFTLGLEDRISNEPSINVEYDTRNVAAIQSTTGTRKSREHRQLPLNNPCVQATISLTRGLGINSLDHNCSMLPYVDPSTGAGLRDYITMREMITGSRKRDCRSISFHDFTPDMREGTPKNQLLAHFGVEAGFAGAERIECKEIDLIKMFKVYIFVKDRSFEVGRRTITLPGGPYHFKYEVVGDPTFGNGIYLLSSP
ncbi:hypothetical protein ACMFMF_003422 [Clarireedia jacksonii]